MKASKKSKGVARGSLRRRVSWRADPTADYIGAHLVNPRFVTGKAICGKRPMDVWMIAEDWDRRCEACQKLSPANGAGEQPPPK